MAGLYGIKTDRHGDVFGLAGWSGSCKTTLVEQVVSHLVGLGYDVATVKHAHHHFDADIPGKDSFRHRQAGARQVLVSSAQRSALFSEHASRDEPDLPQLLQLLAPADLLLAVVALLLEPADLLLAAVALLLEPADQFLVLRERVVLLLEPARNDTFRILDPG